MSSGNIIIRQQRECRTPVSLPGMGRHMVDVTTLVNTNNDQNQIEEESEESNKHGVDRAMVSRMIANGGSRMWFLSAAPAKTDWRQTELFDHSGLSAVRWPVLFGHTR